MIIELIKEIVNTFFQMAPYLLLGLTFAGILHVLFTKKMVARHLGGNSFSSVIKAALLGVPLPLCSCGVVPTALSLRKSNASEGATVSFLISTPQTGVDSIIATYGMLGPLFAIFRPVTAFIMGIAGGAVTNLFVKNPPVQNGSEAEGADCKVCTVPTPHRHTLFQRVWVMAKYGYGEFLDDISKQLVAGVIISGLISYFLPDDFFTRYVGNDFLEMLIMIIGGIPLYVCATASIPIALALMTKGVSAGAAFVFLTVGPATNAATVTLIANVMGRKVVTIYLAVISVFSIIAGYSFNFIVDHFYGGNIGIDLMAHHHVHNEASAGLIFSYIFLAMLILSLFRIYLPDTWKRMFSKHKAVTAGEAAAQTSTIGIDGMTCNKCAQHVTGDIQKVKGVQSVDVSLKKKAAVVTGDFNVEEVKEAVRGAGYKVRE